MPQQIQQKLKGKMLEKYKDTLSKATFIQPKKFKCHTGSVESVAFSSCGKYALTGLDDDTARLWNLATSVVIRKLKGHTRSVTSVAISRCGNYALTGSADHTARLWDLSTVPNNTGNY